MKSGRSEAVFMIKGRSFLRTVLVTIYWLVLFVAALLFEGVVVFCFVAVLFPNSIVGWILGLALAVALTIVSLVWIWRGLA